MKNIRNLLDQLTDKFDLIVTYSNGGKELKLPPGIKITYDTFYIKIETTNFIAVSPKDEESHTVKRLEMIRDKYDEPIIYISEAISAPIRAQLVKKRISYVTSNMIYLYPLYCLGDDRLPAKHKRKKYTVNTQPILLHMIYNNKNNKLFEIEDFRHFYDVTNSTIYRYLKLLEELELVILHKDGQKKLYELNKKLSIEQLLNTMSSPIKSVTYIYDEDYYKAMSNEVHFLAGESGLNRFNLAVSTKTYAVFHKDMKKIIWDTCKYSTNYYEDYIKLELWHYDPKSIQVKQKAINTTNNVDSISLYLSLTKGRKMDDIRVENAKESLFEDIKQRYQWQQMI